MTEKKNAAPADELTKLKADLAESEKTSSELAKMNDDQKAELVDAQKAVEDLKAELSETIEKASEQVKSLEEQLKTVTEEKEALEKKSAPAEKSDDDEKPAKTPKGVAGLLEEIISMASPVRGALSTKPKVQETWNVLMDKVIKAHRSIK